MKTRDEILAEVNRLIEESRPQPNDVYVQDLIDMGMDNSAAEKYLNAKAKAGELRKVSVVVDGRRRNAFRPG